MFRWAMIFGLITIILAAISFGGFEHSVSEFSKMLMIGSEAIFVLFVILGMAAGEDIRRVLD